MNDRQNFNAVEQREIQDKNSLKPLHSKHEEALTQTIPC
jgi:hypothetical protein